MEQPSEVSQGLPAQKLQQEEEEKDNNSANRTPQQHSGMRHLESSELNQIEDYLEIKNLDNLKESPDVDDV